MKTIEEAAEEYSAERLRNKHEFDDYPEKKKLLENFNAYDIEQAFEDGVNYALKNKWISVDDKLPKEGERVFVIEEDELGRFVTSVIYRRQKWFMYSKYVKYWMHVPIIPII